MDSHELVIVLIKNCTKESEAHECQNTISCFPFIIQEEWSNTRDDGKEDQHYNLTQVPSDVDVDEFGFYLDYHITIHFETL